jgi:hypothetical protein
MRNRCFVAACGSLWEAVQTSLLFGASTSGWKNIDISVARFFNPFFLVESRKRDHRPSNPATL